MRAETTTSAQRLLVAGVHVESSGYPNVSVRLKLLRDRRSGVIDEINFPFRSRGFEKDLSKLWKPLRFISSLGRVALAHLFVICRLAARRSVACVYIPYPAVFLLYGLSLLPRGLRPRRIVADTFISLFDTIVVDRGLLAHNGAAAKILKHIESRAYACSDLVIVDTEPNADYFKATFELPAEKILVAPLSTDDTIYRFQAYQPRTGPARVLFVGTFVPLQGVDTIARAAALLRERRDVEFVLIGDGQTGCQVSQLLQATPCPNLRWIRSWQPPSVIARQIGDSDICLGIFGTGGKTSRVWPLKNYAYMAVGRAIVTADTVCARRLSAGAALPPFVTCAPGDPRALATALVELVVNPERRANLAAAGRALYDQRLSNDRGYELLDQALQLPATDNSSSRS